ncbi:MAG TPA: DoxX family membrane protein [Chryseosolibacter sp.]|nr:DoxX family membrane protein [Chryseosolibacter sp.]
MATSKFFVMWLLRLVAAFIMVQSLFFKFSGADESVYIFSMLGIEPWGRIGTAIVELLASILLLIPGTSWLGAGLGLATMSGAIFFHLTRLGVEVKNDGGQLFIYAIITWVCCLVVVVIEKQKIRHVLQTSFLK